MRKALLNWFINSSAAVDDAQAFITAANITDPTEQAAITTLVSSLKSNSLWTPMKAIYPMVGSASGTCKFNLKDPRDLDAAFRLAFSGGWTFSANGALPNGTTGYASTFNTLSNFSASNGSLGVYTRTLGVGGYDMGSSDGTDTKAAMVISRYSGDLSYYGTGTTGYSNTAASTDGRGFFVASRTSGTVTTGLKNGSSVVANADESVQAGVALYLGAMNKNGTASYFGSKEIAFAFIADTLTVGQVATLYTVVQAFQTTLGRQV